MQSKAYNIHFSILQFILPTMGTIICYALLIREVTVMVKNEEGECMTHDHMILYESYGIISYNLYDSDMS